MLQPMATAWIPAAVGVGVPTLVLLFIWVSDARSRRGESDETDGSDGGGGLSARRSPRRPPPVGPVSWPEFERQFAEYVARRPERSAIRARTHAKRTACLAAGSRVAPRADTKEQRATR
jgi:hypothetical protein